jgi:CBS domain-containing protein
VKDEAGQLVGVLTEGDLLRRSETRTERHRPRWLEVLAGPGPIAGEYASRRSPAADKRVLVLDSNSLVGIVSRAGLLRASAQMHSDYSVSA